MTMDCNYYFDSASTSFPKPESVYSAMDYYARNIGVSGNRGSLAKQTSVANLLDGTRESLLQLINANAGHIVFTSGATEALNNLILGLLKPGDHVIVSPWEHSAVRRPLEYLANNNVITYSVCKGSLDSGFSTKNVEDLIQPSTRLVLVNWVSNVLGIKSPINEIGQMLDKRGDIIFAVDASQCIGSLPIDVDKDHIKFLAFPGHKALFGPVGIGGFYLHPDIESELEPIKYGGTGSRAKDYIYVDELPYKFEVGTQNSLAIAGLAAGVEYVVQQGVDNIQQHIKTLSLRMSKQLTAMPFVQTYLPHNGTSHGVISFNIHPLSSRDVASLLSDSFGISVRDGLHCAVNAHQMIGTEGHGTVRASLSIMNTEKDVDYFCEAIKEIGSNVS